MASQTTAGTRSPEETTIIDTAAAAAADRVVVQRAEAATDGACDVLLTRDRVLLFAHLHEMDEAWLVV